MFEIPSEQWWSFMGVVVAIIAILVGVAVAIIVYLMQRQRKELSYDIISSTPLLSHEEEVKGKLQISFEGKPVEKVQLVLVRIANSGNVPIEAKDYERQINFSFGESAQVLAAEVAEVEPRSLEVPPNVEGKKVVLPRILMNKGDSFTVKMLVNGYKGLDVDGRIAGIKEIVNARFVRGFRVTGILLIVVWLITFLIYTVLVHEIIRYMGMRLEWWHYLLLLFSGSIPMIFLLRWSVKRLRKDMRRSYGLES